MNIMSVTRQKKCIWFTGLNHYCPQTKTSSNLYFTFRWIIKLGQSFLFEKWEKHKLFECKLNYCCTVFTSGCCWIKSATRRGWINIRHLWSVMYQYFFRWNALGMRACLTCNWWCWHFFCLYKYLFSNLN